MTSQTFKLKSIVSLVENYKIPFGKYRGCRLQEVEDGSYLKWMAEKSYKRLDQVIVKAYLDALRYFAVEEVPFYIPEQQLTKYIMMKRQEFLEMEKEANVDVNELLNNENQM